MDFGIKPEQFDAAIAGLAGPDAEQWFTELDAAFQQHQNPNWQLATVPTEDGQGLEQRFIAPDVSTGAVQRGEGSIPVPPGEVQSFGSGGLYRNNQNSPNGYEVLREPRSVAAGGGGAQYRPITPEEAQAYGLPTGVTAGTIYYVLAAGITSDTFQFSATDGGAAINTSGTQSGVHTGVSVVDTLNYACQYVRTGGGGYSEPPEIA